MWLLGVLEITVHFRKRPTADDLSPERWLPTFNKGGSGACMGMVGVVLVWAVLGVSAPASLESQAGSRVLVPDSSLMLEGWRASASTEGATGALEGVFIEAYVPSERAGLRPLAHLFGFAMGWGGRFAHDRALWAFRAGYRHGLELGQGVEAPVVLTSGGSIEIRAGTVAQLKMDLEGFHEVEGSRRVRLDAIPGVRVQPRWALPLSAGIGIALSARQVAPTTFERHCAVLVQLSSPLL
jgi:hypothetical protein